MNDLLCSATGVRYPSDTTQWRSAEQAPFDLDFAGHYEPDRTAQRPMTLWRYREALPFRADVEPVTLGEGCTPLVPLQIDGLPVQAKLECLLPTGSYKDRGSSVLLTHLRERGATSVINDSSGNAGASVACYAARAGIDCGIYVPAGNAPAKLLQIELYGATLHKVPGTREDSTTACMGAVGGNTRYASHVWNPYFVQGCKTYLYEVYEQRGGKLPEALLFPVGNGALLLGSWLAMQELRDDGLIQQLPQLIAIQAETVAPLAQAWSGNTADFESGVTAAEGIAVRQPARAGQILHAIRETNGRCLTVTESQIRAATLWAAAQGFCIEPTSATTIAAVRAHNLQGDLVLAFTGNGLKAGSQFMKWQGA